MQVGQMNVGLKSLMGGTAYYYTIMYQYSPYIAVSSLDDNCFSLDNMFIQRLLVGGTPCRWDK